jgi:hypothetical protein
MLAIHALEPTLHALGFRTVAFDVRLQGLILHVARTGTEPPRFLNRLRRFSARAQG